jgi:hypothetical protein
MLSTVRKNSLDQHSFLNKENYARNNICRDLHGVHTVEEVPVVAFL